MSQSIAERFWPKVDRRGASDCWLWTGAVFQSTGYGAFRIGGRGGRTMTAHRVAYNLTFGETPTEMQIHHECRTRLCVNPTHLRAVTPSQHNVLDPRYRGKRATHCANGHEYTPENSRLYVNKRGYVCRSCRTCCNAAARRCAAKKRAA